MATPEELQVLCCTQEEHQAPLQLERIPESTTATQEEPKFPDATQKDPKSPVATRAVAQLELEKSCESPAAT